MRGAPSPLGLEKNTVRPLMAVRSFQVAGGLAPNSLVLYWMTACVRRSAVQVASASRSSAATADCDVGLEGLEQPALLHEQYGREVGGIDHVDLQAPRVGLGQHLRGHIVGAASVVLHVDAVLVLERLDDGIDDLGVEARVEHDLALGLGLGEIDVRRTRGSAGLAENATCDKGCGGRRGEASEHAAPRQPWHRHLSLGRRMRLLGRAFVAWIVASHRAG